MKKYLSVLLSVVAVVLSICSISLNVKTLKVVNSLKAEGIAKETEAGTVDFADLADQVVNDLSKDEESDFTDEQMEAINKAIVEFLAEQEKPVNEETTEGEAEAETNNEEEQVVEEEKYTFSLTEDERQARRQKQEEIQQAREYIYTQPHSVENAQKLNQLDEMMIANNTYNFTDKIINFLGDSVTEGVGASTDSEGNPKSYPTYIDNVFHFEKCLNHGTGGWMYSTFAGDEVSIVANRTTKIYIDSDILVFYFGINDFISDCTDKRFGTYSSTTTSTAGFCGDLEVLCTFLSNYFEDKDIFFVLTYPITHASGGTYQNDTEPHELVDYMSAIKTITTRHGFNVIDIYNSGLMDGTILEMQQAYQSDFIHPNDNGYKLIGEHIAAEISYVLGKK